MGSNSLHSASYQRLVAVLKELREHAGMTQTELATKLGEDQTYISKVERRERRIDVVELRRYSEALSVPMETLVRMWEGEAEVVADSTPTYTPNNATDRKWTEKDWRDLLQWLVDTEIVSFREITSLTLGHLNPSQVGTSIASKKSFQKHFPARKTWQAVRKWHFEQSGRCIDCGTRLELQADHVVSREQLGEQADRLENMTLRCRRCNVIRRPSHKKGGLTFLTAEAALMWILFTKRPRTYQGFEQLCRAYGLTMANIRFQESWAMARWLEREGLYEIDPESTY